SRRRHTRSYGDWSSDVCSSDLRLLVRGWRLSRRVGQRTKSLQAIVEAAALARKLKLPARVFDELRTEATAALVLPDFELVAEWRSEERRVGKEGRAWVGGQNWK